MIKLNAPTELRSTLATMKSANAKGVNMNIWESDIKAVQDAIDTIEAIRALPEASAQRQPSSLPLCCVTGLIAGDKDACGDCDPCGAAYAVPEPIKELMRNRDEWANKYGEAMGQLDELRGDHAERATVSRKQLAEMLDELVRERSIVQRGRILDFVCSDPGECQSPAVTKNEALQSAIAEYICHRFICSLDNCVDEDCVPGAVAQEHASTILAIVRRSQPVTDGYRTCPADGDKCLCDDTEAFGCFSAPGSRLPPTEEPRG